MAADAKYGTWRIEDFVRRRDGRAARLDEPVGARTA